MALRNAIEVELINGNKILLLKDWDKVYNLKEKTAKIFKWTKKFPFFTFEKLRCTSFKYRTEYLNLNSIMDPRYCVKCTLSQFAFMFDVSIKPFETALVESDLAYG